MYTKGGLFVGIGKIYLTESVELETPLANASGIELYLANTFTLESNALDVCRSSKHSYSRYEKCAEFSEAESFSNFR